nr:MAG TPA_asm: hypothetical protein [Caudoviricetes sp.]
MRIVSSHEFYPCSNIDMIEAVYYILNRSTVDLLRGG